MLLLLSTSLAPVVAIGSVCVYVSEWVCAYRSLHMEVQRTTSESQVSSFLPAFMPHLPDQTQVVRLVLQVLLPMAHLASTRSDCFILATQLANDNKGYEST